MRKEGKKIANLWTAVKAVLMGGGIKITKEKQENCSRSAEIKHK